MCAADAASRKERRELDAVREVQEAAVLSRECQKRGWKEHKGVCNSF